LLSGHYQVITLDLLGLGQSSIPGVAYTEEFFRQATSEFITKLDLRHVTLVGESIGGVLALTVSTELPDRVKRIVSLNPYDYRGDFGGSIRRSKNGWMVCLFTYLEATLSSRDLSLLQSCEVGYMTQHNFQRHADRVFSYRERDGYRGAEYSSLKIVKLG
jgi:pimeloyl-ACP methyl ester carboxylesterase